MMLYSHYRQHAIDCGLDMTCADAIGIEDAAGHTLAHHVCDPVHLDRLILSGTTLTQRQVQWLMSFGVDYVTVRI